MKYNTLWQILLPSLKYSRTLLLTLLLFSGAIHAHAAFIVTGKITNKAGEPLPGASVVLQGTTRGAVADINGRYSLELTDADKNGVLIYNLIGFGKQIVKIEGRTVIDITLEEGNTLEEVVISVGSRNTQRTITDSPVPIDILSTEDLLSAGQNSFDKALQYRVPSFNTINTPVNDATTLLDPYEIRNLGPSRTLMLINGKRKNLSSLLYVQFAPGRGETGVDLSAIPTEAIKRVEILRDGASAQYGSDAIAGVMNIILKDRYEYSTLNINGGITGKGDGATYGVALNSGSNFGDKGYLNYTLAFNQQDNAVRSGTVDVATEIATFGGDPATDQQIRDYLARYPTANNTNGTGASTAGKFEINAGLPLGAEGEIYANAAVVTKRVLSNANFRTPYWKQDYGLLHAAGTEYIGYQPTFEGDLLDYNATIGVKNVHSGWHHDASLTVGGNEQTYSVDNTVNHSLGAKSPISFKPGGFSFSHIVGNLDISRPITDNFGIAFGAEVRSETYTIMAGDTASYSGEGSNSFPGIRADNARSNTRFNLGGYADLSWDITKSWLLNGTARAEKYSDFGNAFVWKFSTRYKIADEKLVFRASASTGFRAPTLHQIYDQSTQASFVGGTIQLSGLFNNKSAEARALGIPALKPEKSTNYTLGIGLKPARNLNITLDYYSIDIKDRIVYSSSISSGSTTSVLGMILANAHVANIQFFINGVNTTTTGLDFVLNYKNIAIGNGMLTFNLAGNYTLSNEINGSPNDPPAIKSDGATILSTQIRSLLTESRPKYKMILGLDYTTGKWNFNLNNTLFGPTAFQDLDNGGSDMENIKQEFSPAVVTDLGIGYSFTKKFSVGVNINNLLDVLPSWKLVALNSAGQAVLDDPTAKNLLEGFLEFSGRYKILGYNGSQFSQLGRIFNINLNYRF